MSSTKKFRPRFLKLDKNAAQDTTEAAQTLDKTPKNEPITHRPSKMKADNAVSHPSSVNLPVPITDLLDADYHGVRLYSVAMLVLVAAILWTGLSVVEQVQTYQQRYTELSELKQDFRQMQVERQRMLIEQQTFSATPQIVNRAVTQLHMFYPELSNRLIIRATPSQANTLPPSALSAPDSQVSSANLAQGAAHD
ncbi:cell division protein FtsL [Moraxella atlantae]|uniref:cell division protein FtsL n=1 Tax=Faucicola atlantae TaxID=34059 RepID=UPI003752E485